EALDIDAVVDDERVVASRQTTSIRTLPQVAAHEMDGVGRRPELRVVAGDIESDVVDVVALETHDDGTAEQPSGRFAVDPEVRELVVDHVGAEADEALVLDEMPCGAASVRAHRAQDGSG